MQSLAFSLFLKVQVEDEQVNPINHRMEYSIMCVEVESFLIKINIRLLHYY